jgi:hypothetical protein
MRADRDFVLNKLRKHEEKNKIFLYLIFNLLGLPLKTQKSSQRDDGNICNNSELSLKLLNKYEKEEYKHIIFFSSSSVKYGFPSPLKNHEMQKKSVDEIIEFLNEEYEQGAIDSREGLVLALEKDVKQNSRKYLDDLLKFKNSNIKPIYIMNLFSGLNGVKENDWANIADIGLSALKRRMPLATSISVDENWNDVYIELLRLFSKELFKSEGLQVDDKVAKVIYNIIKELTFSPDGHLLSKELKANYSGLKYIEAATNSLHGNAMSGLIEYATWQHKNKKNISYIIPE